LDRSTWFAGLQTKEQMNTLVIGEIEVIMGDLSTSADVKVLEIARALDGLNKAWNVKKDLAPTRSEQEIIHHHCNINIERVESLVDFPLIGCGPACELCLCFKCEHLTHCHAFEPTTVHYCKDQCRGTEAVHDCQWNSEKILRNEG